MNRGLKTGFLGFDIPNKTARLYDQGKHPFDMSPLTDVANAVVGVLTHPEETKNRYVHINTFYTSQAKTLEALEKELGSFQVSTVGAKEANEEGAARIKKGDFGGIKDSLMGFMAGGEEGGNGEGVDNELVLGRATKDEGELGAVVAKYLKGETI